MYDSLRMSKKSIYVLLFISLLVLFWQAKKYVMFNAINLSIYDCTLKYDWCCFLIKRQLNYLIKPFLLS